MHRAEVKKTASKVRTFKVGLLGNPNCGKSSVFNYLTGLRQKTGNFPGVTVDKKTGSFYLASDLKIVLTDFPGTYSLYPTSQEERIVLRTFTNAEDPDFPDAIIYIADLTQLEKHLLLFSQIQDLGIPMVLALNMADLAAKRGIQVKREQLEKELQVPVVLISGRTGHHIEKLKERLKNVIDSCFPPSADKECFKPQRSQLFYRQTSQEKRISQAIRKLLPGLQSDYQALLIAHHYDSLPHLSKAQKQKVADIVEGEEFDELRAQVEETMTRFKQLTPLVRKHLAKAGSENLLTSSLDNILTHRWWGPLIFFVIMLFVFQAIFSWASYPMDWIDSGFTNLSNYLARTLPENALTDLLINGIVAGLGGIVIFVPQIAILFFLIGILEEVGYLARVVYLFDGLMQRFGLSGRSIVSLISGGACAIPAIMSTRTISNWKERLITILVTPFISCSARIPVYTVLIAFVVPPKKVWWIFDQQGLAFMGLYLIGIFAALGSAYTLKHILKAKETAMLIIELPEYRLPIFRNILYHVRQKVRAFVFNAGKIILMISVLLWGLASYGPPGALEQARQTALEQAQSRQLDEQDTQNLIAAKEIEASYAGLLGKSMEPLIKPLGYDWKIGIALITSFAAREVFVSTMSTIYSIGSDAEPMRLKDRMAQDINPDTGQPTYGLATAVSLLLFYVLAMQCMSTLAVVRRETGSWKWPALQFFFMTGLAYLVSLMAYQSLV